MSSARKAGTGELFIGSLKNKGRKGQGVRVGVTAGLTAARHSQGTTGNEEILVSQCREELEVLSSP